MTDWLSRHGLRFINHAVRFTKGWIRKGVRKEIQTNGSQKRMNIIDMISVNTP